MELQIGRWHFPNGLWAAPLQEITDDPIFRMMCRANGAELIFLPMIDIGEYCRRPDTGRTLLEHAQAEKPFAIQLLGNSKSPTKEFFDQITSFNVEIVDLNLCCAARSALTNNMGGALLRKLGKAADFATSVVKYSPVPVIAKMRSGWSREFNYGSQIGKELEQSGIAAASSR
jgi:tRNA-dihydrouridine synthase B